MRRIAKILIDVKNTFIMSAESRKPYRFLSRRIVLFNDWS
jgi:hypothetical protein